MSDAFSRICYLLAAAGYKEKELADFAVLLISNGIDSFVDNVAERRERIQNERNSTSKGEEISRKQVPRLLESRLADRVTELLVVEARMTKLEASEALRIEMMKQGLAAPPSLGKRGFSDWIDTLSKYLPQSDILHLATRIRNQYVHQSDTDWSLK